MLPRRYPANVGYFSFIIDKTLNSRSYHTLTSFWLDFIAKIQVRTYFGNYLQKTLQKWQEWLIHTGHQSHSWWWVRKQECSSRSVAKISTEQANGQGLFQRSGLFTICLAFQKDLMTTNYVRVFSRRLVICALSKLIPRISPIIEKRWHTLI